MRILLTGFGPFGEEDVNPSSTVAIEASRRLREAGYEAKALELPVSYRRAGQMIENAVAEYKPWLAIALGLYGGVTHVRVERVALNIMDFSTSDVDGAQPVDEPVDPEGPPAYFSSIPTRRVVERLRAEGIPAALSYSAGTYLCNYVMYKLLRLSDVRGAPVRAGFIHLPYTPELASRKKGLPPSLPLELQVKAVLIAVEESLKNAGKP